MVVAVDRKSRLITLGKIKTTAANETNLKTKVILDRSGIPCRSITNDNGHEFGEFWNLESAMNVKTYFTHPLCPWERGTVENTIGLLRQHLPKGTDFTEFTDQDLRTLEHHLNSRPRKSLGFRTPSEIISGRFQKLIRKKKIEIDFVEYYQALARA